MREGTKIGSSCYKSVFTQYQSTVKLSVGGNPLSLNTQTGAVRRRLCSWRVKAILHRPSSFSKEHFWPCCYGKTAGPLQTWQGLRYLQGNSRGRGTELFGEGSRHRAQLPQHREGMREREQRRWPEGWRDLRQKERDVEEKTVRCEIKKKRNSEEEVKTAAWCDSERKWQTEWMNRGRKQKSAALWTFYLCDIEGK